MSATATSDRLPDLYQVFRTLNPESVSLIETELFALAEALGRTAFDQAAVFAQELVALYVDSPVKRAEREVLSEYFYFLQKAEKLLPELASPASPVAPSVALVPARLYTELQWFELTSKAAVPKDIVHAVDAAQRRNALVQSVLETFFRFLIVLDAERAFDWQLGLCRDAAQPIDPDVARDLLRAWRRCGSLPKPVLQQARVWSDDGLAFRHWPAVIEEADRLLRKQWFWHWLETADESDPNRRRLQLLKPFDDDRKLSRWLTRTLWRMSDSIDFFITESQRLVAAEEGRGWRQDALFRELVQLAGLLPPLLVVADLTLSAPDGAFEFAMSFFGFSRDYRRSWRQQLEEKSARAIRRGFIEDLKADRPPRETIRLLSFGDQTFEAEVMAELDSLTGRFDSIRQRELVIDKLTAMYASYREGPLLATEIGRRYRRLMQVLHRDRLQQLLTAEQLAVVVDSLEDLLLDLSTIASAARKYLSRRRALELSTAEIVAAESDFVDIVRQRRSAYLRARLGL